MQGQINLNTNLGIAIYNLIKDYDIKNILEIGTWNGYGSTMCIIRSLIDNAKNCNFISVEANHSQFMLASSNLKNYQEYVKLLYGRITSLKDLVSLEDYDSSFFLQYSKAIQEQWYQVDVEQHHNSPYIYDEIISMTNNNIDLLILDGGEYCTYGEFSKLKNISNFIILDDTNTIKNYKAAEEIRSCKNIFKIIEDNQYDRNGYMICQRV